MTTLYNMCTGRRILRVRSGDTAIRTARRLAHMWRSDVVVLTRAQNGKTMAYFRVKPTGRIMPVPEDWSVPKFREMG
jgi:hypothetical protein